MEINEKIDEIIQQAKEEGAYQDDFSAFEQEIYDQGFRNAIYFMLWNPSERSCSNCEHRYSRELCGEEYCGQKYWSPKLEEQLWLGVFVIFVITRISVNTIEKQQFVLIQK